MTAAFVILSVICVAGLLGAICAKFSTVPQCRGFDDDIDCACTRCGLSGRRKKY